MGADPMVQVRNLAKKFYGNVVEDRTINAGFGAATALIALIAIFHPAISAASIVPTTLIPMRAIA